MASVNWRENSVLAGSAVSHRGGLSHTENGVQETLKRLRKPDQTVSKMFPVRRVRRATGTIQKAHTKVKIP